MFGCDVAIETIFCFLYVFNQVFISCHGMFYCIVSKDRIYGGCYVDCSYCHLLSSDIVKLDYNTTTTLIISDNDIVTLQNKTFSKFKDLKRLECVQCNLFNLKVDALKGLDKLEVLRLNDNHLGILDHAFPFGFFRHTPHITNLSINANNNNNKHHASNYSMYIDIFDFLPLLEELAIDSFSNLVIGKEFTRFNNLETLRVNCKYLKSISNDSLKGFQDSNVKKLVLSDGIVYSPNIGFSVFHYLPKVSSLVIEGLYFRNINPLRLMEPLQGRKIDTIHLNDGLDETDDSTIFLRNICVSHLEMTNSGILASKDKALFSTTWQRCLTSLKMNTKQSTITINSAFWVQAWRLENLKSFTVTSLSQAVESKAWKKNVSMTTSIKTKIVRTVLIPVRIPSNLTTIYLSDFYATIFSYEHYFASKNSIITIYLPRCGLELYGKISGLNSLAYFDFTGATFEGCPDFFSTFPSLRQLVMSDTGLTSDFLNSVVNYIPNLEYFDISKNGLTYLPPGMFQSNWKLKYLCLLYNQFSTIPFDLTLTPHLEGLDLRDNTFVDLSAQDRQAINDHIQMVSNFKLLLSANKLACVCSNLQFLEWLQNHGQYLDQHGNYKCKSEKGTMSNTGHYRDMASFWRKCHGFSYFLVSLYLTSVLVAFYLAVFLGMKHKTHILSKVRQLVVPGFRLKTRQDFAYDVCIGYADQDGEYVRDVLLRYLENMWNLRTFVHQRDLLQDPLLLSQAQRDSYRNVLLITENFLHHCHMAHNVMKVATFFVSDTNPSSVLVMVERRVQHQIPDYVLQVVDEDNIIVLPRLQGFLDYEAKETLRTRIIM